VYEYAFDNTTSGHARYSGPECGLLLDALTLLKEKLDGWNKIAVEHGAAGLPYAQEVADLDSMIEWYKERLTNPPPREITALDVSVGSLRYHKAALIYAAWVNEQNVETTVKSDWPSAVQESLRSGSRSFLALAEKINFPPAAILDELRPEFAFQMSVSATGENWDVFISHAHEDKSALAAPLATELRERGLRVWYDEFALMVGDSLRRSIDRGLARSRFGIVILSPRFFQKEWPQKELDGLVARESQGQKVILPVWHDITADAIRRYSPMLADRVGVPSSFGIAGITDALVKAISAPSNIPLGDVTETPRTRRVEMELPDEARSLLLEASLDRDGAILKARTLGGQIIQVNGKTFGEPTDRRSAAKWEFALEQLRARGLVVERGTKGEMFEITEQGYQLVDLFKDRT
jgi:hypothetical protein